MVTYLSFMILFILGSLSFSMKRKHLLLMLLSLEFLVLSMFFSVIFYFNMREYYLLMREYYFSLIFISFSVCEGALGLSLLVFMIRTHGHDYFQTFNILW